MEKNTRAEIVAEIIRNSDDWYSVEKELSELCELAGISDDWEKSDGDTFEQVAYKAAEILGVEI